MATRDVPKDYIMYKGQNMLMSDQNYQDKEVQGLLIVADQSTAHPIIHLASETSFFFFLKKMRIICHQFFYILANVVV